MERLFGLLATGAIRPHIADRIAFDEVPDAHRRLEAGGLEGKLVLCPNLPSRRDRVPRETATASKEAPTQGCSRRSCCDSELGSLTILVAWFGGGRDAV